MARMDAGRAFTASLTSFAGDRLRNAEGIEVGAGIESIHALPAFQPRDPGIGEGSSQRLVGHLDQVGGKDQPDQGGPGDGAGKGDEHNQEGIERLADDGGSDGAGPEPASSGKDLKLGQGEGIGKLARSSKR